MPNEQELAAYAATLPEIYRDILAAFPAIERGRHAGQALAIQTLAIHFANVSKEHSFAKVQFACQELEKAGFLTIEHGFFAQPTPLGEKMITIVSGHEPRVGSLVPPLPERPW